MTVRSRRQRTLHRFDQHIQYLRQERIQDLLAEEPYFIPSSKHIAKYREDQKLEQMAEGGKHIIQSKEEARVSDEMKAGSSAQYLGLEP